MAVLVTSMGAVGDGKTDSSSDFQRAIDSLPQEGEVLVPAGTYIIKNVQLRSKIWLAGEGKASILKLPPSSRVWDMLFITGGNTAGEQIDIAHLTLDGSRDLIGLSDVQMHGIDIRSGSKQVTVTGITAQNMCGDGIRTTHDGQLGTVPSRIQIEQCFFTGIGRQDIAVIQGYDLIIQECCGTGTLDIEPEDPLIKRIAITGCDFKKLVISANDREQTADIVVTGCTIQESTVWNARGVNMGSNEIKHLRVSTAQDITLSGNSFRMLELYPTSDQTCTNVVVTGNLIQNITDAEGIPLGGASGNPGVALYMWKAIDCILTGNLIRAESDGIYVSSGCHRSILQHNQVTLVPGPLTPPPESGGSAGIAVINASHDLDISGNTLQGWHNGILSDGSENPEGLTVQHNIFKNCTGEEATVFLSGCVNTTITGNIFDEDQGMTVYKGNAMITNNHFTNSVNQRIVLSQTTAVVGLNTAVLDPAHLLLNASSSVSYSGEDFIILKSPNGKHFSVSISNEGKLITLPLP